MQRLIWTYSGFLTAALLLLCSLPADASAQDLPAPFKGVDAVGLLVESLDPQGASQCNVNKASLDAAARLTIDRSRLRIAERNSADAYVYVNVTLLVTPSRLCVANIDVALNRMMLSPSAAGREPRDDEVVFGAAVWSTASLLTGPSYDFGSRVNAAVTDQTNQLVGAWVKANPR